MQPALFRLLGGLLLLPRLALAGPGEVMLRDTAEVYGLGPYWSQLVLPASGSPATLAQVQTAPLAGRFRPSPGAVPVGGQLSDDVWLRCRLRSAAGPTTAWVLEAAGSNMPFDVFVVGDDGSVRKLEVGAGSRWATSHAIPGRRFSVNLPLQPGLDYTLYIHSHPTLFLFNIGERTHLLALRRSTDMWACIYFGLLLGMVGYNLLLFFSVRDRSYLYYVLFTASFGALQVVMMGYTYARWGQQLSTLQHHLLQISLLAMVMAFSILTTRSFLETRRLLPRLDLALRVVLALTPLLPLLVVLGHWPALDALATVLPLSVCGLLLVAGTRLLATGHRSARYYMAGWAVLIAAIVVYYLRTLGIIPISFITENGVRIASALEVLLLSLGLADRINISRRERHEAQALALAALQEKETAQTAANEALAQRATELQHAYAELQTSHQTTDRLQQTNLLKTRFFTNISHELRTPLTLILGPLEQLLTRPEAAPLAAEHQLMHRQGQRLLALLNQLLDIARLEAGQLRLRLQPTNLTAFVGSCAAGFEALAAARRVRFTVRVPSRPLPALVDADQLEKVLTNLLGNALKFTPANGQVTVDLTQEDGSAVVTVADTGCGIPTAHLPLVFDRFHQVDDSATRHHEGAGIGLSLVKELVALHQGSVAVVSTEGAGSIFTVRLPLRNEALEMRNEELAEEHEQATEIESTPDPRPLVLIVDDHADMRTYVASCLGDGYRLCTAADGLEGLARVAELGPDLVVSDVMMPGLDGFELCRRLKTNEHSSHIPVVLLTARTSHQGKLEGLELGADDYLTKPFSAPELRVRVANLIAQRQLLRQRFGREVTLQPRDISITSADETFLNRAMTVVENHLAEAEFDVETFASDLNISRIQLYRKLKALTDQAPTEFVRTLRLRHAAQLLAAQAGTVADVGYAVGFSNLSYFSKCFREQFGHVPSEHLAQAATA